MTNSTEEFNSLPFSYLRVAWQSALATGLCLGLPIVLMFWMVVLASVAPSPFMNNVLSLLQNTWYPFANENQPSTPIHDFLMALQLYVVTPGSISLSLGILIWTFLFSKISGYRPWWHIFAAAMIGVFVGKAPIDWLDTWIQRMHPPFGWTTHIVFAVFLSLSVLCVAVATGIALGLVLRNWKASLTLATASGLASIVAVIAADQILWILHVRVGGGHLAMPKLTAVGTMAAAIAGGTVLGVLFTYYYHKQRSENVHAAQHRSITALSDFADSDC